MLLEEEEEEEEEVVLIDDSKGRQNPYSQYETGCVMKMCDDSDVGVVVMTLGGDGGDEATRR